ncbi:MAG: polymer-forming cytoskeletal protein [Desulfobacteraceae bacterium]|jgi:cytoskeletal protein CcmA (bactofilin family)
MFGRKKKHIDDENFSFVEGGNSQARQVMMPKPVKKVNQTVIGEHITIEGNIRGEENLLIEGTMKGKVEMPKHNFNVSAKGHFEGEVRALNVNIRGNMTGKIKSFERTIITKDANFHGDIKTKTISLEDGAYFKGNIELDQERSSKSADANKPSDSSAKEMEPKSTVQTKRISKAS